MVPPNWLFGGSIPAWAGEPQRPASRPVAARVYPRVGGGTDFVPLQEGNNLGLSPRGRGNRLNALFAGLLFRSIPAWAGEPLDASPCFLQPGVYPRVGGEPLLDTARSPPPGVYPRVGGGTKIALLIV